MSDPRASRWSYAGWASPAELPAEPMETYESWVVRSMVSGLAALRESLAARPAEKQDIPPMPAVIADPTGIVREAWAKFHSAKERPVTSIAKGADRVAARRRPRPSRPRPGSEDPSAWPEHLRP